MDHDEPVEVYSTSDPNDAEIIRIALEGEGIECKITDEHQAGFTGIGMVPVKLYVRAEDSDRAIAYIKKHQHHG